MRFVLFAVLLHVVVGCSSANDGPQSLGDTTFHVFRVGSTNIIAIIDATGGTLVDTSEYGSADLLAPRLLDQGLWFDDFERVVLTHAHHDHAGDVLGFRARGVPAWLHADDADMMREGQNREAEINGLEAEVLWRIIDHSFPGSDADIAFDADFTLHDGALEVRHVGGHTAGSVVAVLDGKVAFIGDLLRGGYLGGMFAANQPMEHYFHEDGKRVNEVLRSLIDDTEIEQFWPAHGGLLTRADIEAFLDDADAE
jgi:hydroxyacylglutathione hydrolase